MAAGTPASARARPGSRGALGSDLGAARERVRVARALATLPALAEALAHGELSYAKVRALTRVATPETEARLLAVGRAGTAAHVERIVRGWRRVDRQAEAREAARQHAGRALHVYRDEDGTVVLRGRLAPEVGALLLRALDAARETLYQRRRATEAVLPVRGPGLGGADLGPAAGGRAGSAGGDGVASRARSWGPRGAVSGGGPRGRRGPGGSGRSPGSPCWRTAAHVSAETSRRLACDASRVVMRHDGDGRVVEVGARTRTIPPALRRALQHRDRSCRFPACKVRVGQGHHVRHWAQGGPTTLSNLALLCRRHHRAVHEEGYQRRARARRGAPVPAAERPAAARRAAAGGGARRSRRGAAGAARRAGAPAPRAHGTRRVAGGAPGRGLGDRRAASAREAAHLICGAATARLARPASRVAAAAPPRCRRSAGSTGCR